MQQQRNTRQLLSEALQQVNLLTSCFLAFSDIIEEKCNISHGDLVARINKVHQMRMRGITENEYQNLKNVAERLQIVRERKP